MRPPGWLWTWVPRHARLRSGRIPSRAPAIIAAMADAQATSYSGRTAWARNLAAPVRDFLSTETGSAVVLLGAAIVALVWSNSPWSDSYESVWTTKLSIHLGGSGISADLRHWVNEGLMTFFFLVVGLEAKREFDLGELRERRRLAIPVLAAIGGMAVPVAIYLAFNAGGAGAHGWGAAMSTDTAFALGALALLTPRGDAAARVPADARGRRRPRRAARDRDGLHQAPLAHGAGRGGRAVRRAARAALRAGLAAPGLGAGRRGAVGGDVQVGHRPGDRRAGDRAGDERLPALARGPRAGDRADALVPRAAHARAGALRAAERALGDLAQRAPAVRPAPVDELRDRAAVRARQRGHPRDGLAARRRDQLADHARDRGSATSSASRSASSAPRGSPRGRPSTGRGRRSAGRSWPAAAPSRGSASPSRC